MPTFEFETAQGRFQVEAPNEGAALSALQGLSAGSGPKVDPNTMQPPGVPAYDPGVPGYDPQTGERSRFSRGESALVGAMEIGGMGWADEIASYPRSLATGEPRDQVLARMQAMNDRAFEENPGPYIAGGVGAGIGNAYSLARSGLSLAGNAISRGASLGAVARASAADGGIWGAIQGLGSGTDFDSRLTHGAIGALGGLGIGAVGPYAVAGAKAALSPLTSSIMSRFRPDDYATRALADGMGRSGRSTDAVVDAMTRAQEAGQGMYTMADAMGHSGQRMLSTVARNPNDARQVVVDALLRRQMGQGDRLSSFLAEGFDAPDTAMQRAATLTAERNASANVAYGAAREAAGPVNLNGVVGEIDRLLGRDPILGDTALSAGPLGARLNALRDQLQRGGEQLVDFDRVLNIKSDMFQQMQRNPQAANDLRSVYSRLDEALEEASSGYRTANDAYRTQSRTIDAVDAGKAAVSGRTRAADNIDTFNRMSPADQQAFRAGYADQHIARTEAQAIAPSTNKARPLMTEKTGQEFPAFAAPGRADRLGERIAREQQMFETSNAALGGSKTADNLADAAEASKFDPSVMTKLFSGRPVSAILDAVGRLINEGRGLRPSVLARVGHSLMETNPQAARALLETAGRMSEQQARQNALANAVLTYGGSGAAGRTP